MEIAIYTDRRFEPLDRFLDSMVGINLSHRSSEVGALLGIADAGEMEYAVERAMRVCRTGHIPAELNFRRIFTCRDHDVVSEWLLSDLAMRLVILNADPVHPMVAQAQLHLTKSL